MRANATLTYNENGTKESLPMRVDYFFNSNLVNDYNETGIYDGSRAEVEVIAKGINFEVPLDSYTDPYLTFGTNTIKVLKIVPVAGIGGKVTTFIGVRSMGGSK